MRESRKRFPQALRDLMDERQTTIRTLANHIDRSPALVHQLTTGRTRPTPENLRRISRALGVSPSYFREYRESRATEAVLRAERRVGLGAVLEALDQLGRKDTP